MRVRSPAGMIEAFARGLRACAQVMPLVVVALLAQGCAQSPSGPSASQPRVLLVGIDGATLRVVDPLIRQGKLPNLAAIAAAGASGALRSHYPLLSPRVWTSIATGKSPKKHGIVNWTRIDDDGNRELLQSSDRKVHALWNIASTANRRVATVNWLNTYPTEVINGVVVSDASIPGEVRNREMLFARKDAKEAEAVLIEGTTFPSSWHTRVTELRNGGRLFPDIANPFEGENDIPTWALKRLLAIAFNNDDLVARIALAVEDEIDPDLLLVLMPGIDKISHFMWGALEPEKEYPPELRFTLAQRQASAAALYATYIHADRLIGALMERFGPEDLVMVVSDHGFEARVLGKNATTGGHDTAKALHGVIFARGAGIPPGTAARGVSVNDVTPTILSWWGMPVGEDMDGRTAHFLDVEQVAGIPTYDTSPIERATDVRAPSEDAKLEQLRALGYIEEDEEGHEGHGH